MNLFVTGANGFIGQQVVTEALAQGCKVTALVRSKVPDNWRDLPALKLAAGDLELADNLVEMIGDADVVIHLAATMTGGREQYRHSLQSTRKLLEAIDRADAGYLVGVSSISVLNYIDQSFMDTIDEETPVNTKDSTMGNYAIMKRDQEILLEEWGSRPGNRLVLVRPGLVYDERNLSNAHAGFVKGKIGLAVTHDGQVPLVHVKTVARALVAIAQRKFEHELFHLVNDDLPLQAEYLQALKKVAGSGLRLVPIPWKFYALASRFIRLALKIIGQAEKIPDSFRENSVAGRFSPLTFSNSHARQVLDWKPVAAIDTDSGIFSER